MQLLNQESLLICTYNRYDSLRQVSESLSKCSSIPSSIYIIDSSDEKQSISILSWFSWFCGDLKLLESDAHLTKQRNIGIKLAIENHHIIHFIDDDFFPDVNYFKDLSSFLNQQPNALGVGGQILPIKNSKSTWIERFFLLNNNKPGKVLRSGRTTEPQAIDHLKAPYSTQFLSGCSMSFRSSVFKEHLFDESLKGYAQDEDLDFCLKLPEGSIYVEPKAKGYHKKEFNGRLNAFEFKKMAVLNRWYVMRKLSRHGFHPIYFIWSSIGQLISLLKHPIKNQAPIRGFVHGCLELLK